MKKTILYLVFLISSTFLLWACQAQQKEPQNPFARTASFLNIRDTNCISTFRGGLNNQPIAYMINDTCAIDYIADYHQYIDGVNAVLERDHSSLYSNPQEKLNYGANVDLAELKSIIKWSEENPGKDSLWIMNAIMPATGVTDSTKLIFALKTTTIQGDTTTWRYFDFTRPCPTGCPEWINI